MRKINLLVLTFLISTCISNAQNLPSTLLWKISGNGLEKPSYLYGTMHLTDERIFNLGDSLYKAIETSDGFAIEINPDDLTELMIAEAKKYIMEARKIKDMLNEKEFEKYGPALSKKLKKNKDDITTADVFREKNKWVQESYSKGKMTTFLDAYLFDVARRQGKWTGGVEDMQDQENIMDYLVDKSDIQQLTIDENDNNNKSPNTNRSNNQLIYYYIKNDLNAIDSLSGLEDSLFHDALLTKRNIKMAMRMDSMSHERSMVFAVGAAHLPGGDGVIKLLKEKGFTVTPVFSSKKIKPKDYKLAEVPLIWKDVKDDEGYYTASMPGKPGNMNMYGILNMKMYFDIFSSTAYLTSAINTPYNQNMADSVFETMAAYYFGTSDLKKGKPITIGDVSGREFVSQKDHYSRGYLMSKDGTLYIAIGMSMKQDTSSAKNINRFLQSFTILKKEKGDNSYFTYTDKVKAYSLDVPADPKPANDYAVRDEQHSITSTLNIVTDPKTGAYLLFGVNEASKGYFIESETATLHNMEESLKSKFSSITIDSLYTKNDHKILEYGGMMANAPLMMKAYYQFRGNRWYALVAIYDPAKTNPSVDRFFESFKTLDYPQIEWESYTAEDNFFTTWAPSNFDYKGDVLKYSSDTTYKYECFDSTRADNFMVLPEGFNKYYWQPSDSAFWKKIIANVPYSDSLLSKKEVSNGDTHGYEIMLQKKNDGNISRKRILLNGNKIYSLVTIQPASEINNANNNKFFEDFRFIKPVEATSLFTSKADLLLADLSSTDSATREEAKSSLRDAPFTKQDLPKLHEALLKTYEKEDDSYYNINDLIKNKIITLKEDHSYKFSKENYLKASDENKTRLLDIMASFPTAENFNDIKTLLLQATPKKELGYKFINTLKDTLELTLKIFPDLLPLLKDSVISSDIIRIAQPLLDSNMLSTSLLQPYHQTILELAEKRYKALKSDPDDYDYADNSLADVLGKINTVETNNKLQSWSSLVKHPYLQLEAINGLLDNNQQLNSKVLQGLAADKSNRTDLYDKLKNHKKESLFPKQYLTQKDFAESYVYTAASDEDEPDDLTYLTQKVIDFNGVQSRFFFYKVTYGEGDDASHSLACAGPFNINTTDISFDKASGDLYYEEDFDPSNLPAQMDALIKQVEKWSKERSEDN